MKKTTLFKTMLLAAIFVVGSGNVFGATETIYYENVGTSTGTESLANNEWNNSTPIVYSGDADTRSTQVSSGYEGVSGGRNVFITNTLGRYFQIAGINTSSYSDVELSFGMYKSSTALTGATDLLVECSIDGGVTFTSLSYTNTVEGASWRLITVADKLPVSDNLILKFTQGTTAAQYRIDDIKLTGISTATCTPSNLSFNTDAITKLLTDEEYTLMATSLNETTAITYTSSNENIAVVNVATGKVTIVGLGRATITATQSEGVHSDVEYCASTATYTITVNPTPKTFQLVTSVSELVEGVNYLVVGVDTVTDLVYALGAQNPNNRTPVLVEVVDNKITTPLAFSSGSTWLPNELTLGGGIGAWTLHDPILEKMLGSDKGSGGNNHLKPSDAAPTWTIDVNATTSEADIICFGDEANATRNSLRFNRANLLFACYIAGGQLPVYLYKEVEVGPDRIDSNKKDNDLKPYSVSGRIYFNASEGKTVEIYNVLGQRLYQGITVNGLNSVPASKGIVLVKVGNSASKLIVR